MVWYAAKTVGRETRALFYLARRGVKAFRPEVHRYFVDRHTRQEKFRVTSLFPGYVFVDIHGAAERDRASRAIGVTGLLGMWTGDGFMPKEIPSQWIHDLMDAGPQITGKKIAFRKGERAKVAIGRIGEIITEVEGVDKSGKVRLTIEMFGSCRKVLVSQDKLERVS